jgi:hypothetical protein
VVAGSGGGCGGLRGVIGGGWVDLVTMISLLGLPLLLLISKDEGAKRIRGSWDTLGLDLPSASTKFWRIDPFYELDLLYLPWRLSLNFVLGCLINLCLRTYCVLS